MAHQLIEGTPLGNPALIAGAKMLAGLPIPIPGLDPNIRAMLAELDPDPVKFLRRMDEETLVGFLRAVITHLEWVINGDNRTD